MGAGTFGGVFLGITLFGIGTYHHEFVQPWIYVPGAVLVLLWWFTAPRRAWVRREAHSTVLRDRALRRGANPPVDDETGAERLRLRRLARSLEARRGPRWMRTPMFRRYQLRNE